MQNLKKPLITTAAVVAVLIGASVVAVFSFPSVKWGLRFYLHAQPAPAAMPLPTLPPCAGCNVILISLDDLRGDRLGFIDGKGRSLTPHLDEIARRSAVYTRAHTAAFYTTPSHMSVFTSLYPNQHKVTGSAVKLPRSPRTSALPRALDTRYKTLAEVFKANGYRTAWAGPLHLRHLAFNLGFDRGFDRKVPPLFERAAGPLVLEEPPRGFDQAGLASLLAGKRPFFLFLHSYVTHLPFILKPAPENTNIPFSARRLLSSFLKHMGKNPNHAFGPPPVGRMSWPPDVVNVCRDHTRLHECINKKIDEETFLHAMGQFQLHRADQLFESRGKGTPEAERELKLYVDAYDQSVRDLDTQVGRMWEELQKTGVLDHTLVVFFSDHGEELFEHGEGSHSSFHEHTAHVVLMIHHPALKAGARTDGLVSLVDIMPTLLNLTGLPIPPQVEGHDLSQAPREEYVYGYSLGNDYVFDGQWKLTRSYDGHEELFYLPFDPSENLDFMALAPAQRAYARLKEARSRWELSQAL
jgi:arylsulfatase A-like enzyme